MRASGYSEMESPNNNINNPPPITNTYASKSRVKGTIDDMCDWVIENQEPINEYMGNNYHEYFHEKLENEKKAGKEHIELFLGSPSRKNQNKLGAYYFLGKHQKDGQFDFRIKKFFIDFKDESNKKNGLNISVEQYCLIMR